MKIHAELASEIQEVVARATEIEVWARANLDYEGAIISLAMHQAFAEKFGVILSTLIDEDQERDHQYLAAGDLVTTVVTKMQGYVSKPSQLVLQGVLAGRNLAKKELSKRNKYAAKARHDPSRKKQDELREIWLSGKYSNRNLCAEQEYQALGLSFDTARKALRNTPEPLGRRGP